MRVLAARRAESAARLRRPSRGPRRIPALPPRPTLSAPLPTGRCENSVANTPDEKCRPRRCAASCREAPSARRGRTKALTCLLRPCQPARDARPTRSPYRPWSRPVAASCAHAERRNPSLESRYCERDRAAGCRRGSTWVEESGAGRSPFPLVTGLLRAWIVMLLADLSNRLAKEERRNLYQLFIAERKTQH